MSSEISITNENGKLMTTSKVVADVFNKPHRNVLRDIASLGCSEGFSKLNFEQSEYTTERGKTYKCFNITEHGFYLLAMGFTGKKAMEWKEAFISEFTRLQLTQSDIDNRIGEISKELDDVKKAGQIWSKYGLEVKQRKKIAMDKKLELIDEVQLKLEY